MPSLLKGWAPGWVTGIHLGRDNELSRGPARASPRGERRVRYHARVRRTLLYALLGMALFVVAHPPMLGIGDKALFPGWDATRVFWADLEFFRRSLAGGELPLWNPYDRAGYPFVAEPQSGVFDPVVLLLVGFALLWGSAPSWLIVVKSVIYYGIASSGIAAFLRGRALPTWATVLGVAVFVLCPRMDKLKDQSGLWPIAWMGWLLWAIDRCAAKPSWQRGAALGAIASLVVLSGYPPMAFRIALFAAPYALLVCGRAIVRAEDRRAHARALAVAAGCAAAVLVGLTAAQIWSTLQVLPDTQRAALDLREVYDKSMHVEAIAGIFAPRPITEWLGVYHGFVAIPGLILVALRSSRTALADRWLLASAALGILLACGPNTPVLPALTKLPGFGAFRIPGHYLGVTSFAVAAVTAIGVASLANATRRLAWIGAAAAALGFALALAFIEVRASLPIALAAITAALVGSLGFLAGRRRTIAGWSLVLVTCLDVRLAGDKFAKILQPLPDLRRGEQIAQLLGGDVGHRVADFEWAQNRIGPRLGVRDFTGHRPALTDPRYMMVYRAMPDSVALLRAMNVALVGMQQPGKAARTPQLTRVPDARGLFRVTDPWPLAFWTDDIAIVGSTTEALTHLRRATAPSVVFDRVDVGEQVDDLLAPVSAAAVPAQLDAYTPNRIHLTVDAPAAGIVVVNESFERGWRARVDGEEAPILRGNLIQRAIRVGPGAHTIELRYQPPGVTLLWCLWLATAAALAFAAIRERRRTGRPGHAPSGMP